MVVKKESEKDTWNSHRRFISGIHFLTQESQTVKQQAEPADGIYDSWEQSDAQLSSD